MQRVVLTSKDKQNKMKKNYLIFFAHLLVLAIHGQGIVNIPDANFKDALLNHNPVIDTNGDSEIQVSEAEAFLGRINIFAKNVSDLTGVEAFVNISGLNCGFNNLTEIDVSKNTEITFLSFGLNPIKQINISSNLKLEELLGNFSDLETLLMPNVINENLTDIFLNDTEISQLDTTPFPNLNIISCINAKLNSLDVSNNTKLRQLLVQNNRLVSLNLKNGNNPFLLGFDRTASNFTNNPDLDCIQVDDADFSNTNWGTIKDSGAQFSEDCQGSLGIEELELASHTSVFPIPVIDDLTINSKYNIVSCEVLNLIGKTVLVVNENTDSIDMGHFPTGVYLVKITYDEGVVFKKVCKK